jgi:hypothetical protein
MIARPMKAPVQKVVVKADSWPPPGPFEYIAVDFDNTLFETNFPTIIGPNQHIIDWCKDQKTKGARIILHTCREAERLEIAIEVCREHGLVFDSVNCNPFTEWPLTDQSRKPFADIYIDDKAWRV